MTGTINGGLMHPYQLIPWIGSLALEILLVFAAIRNNIHRRFPVFFAYIASTLPALSPCPPSFTPHPGPTIISTRIGFQYRLNTRSHFSSSSKSLATFSAPTSPIQNVL
jgi:hypothetical protein